MRQPQTTGQLIDTAERRAFVLKLRKAGATYREIADAAVTRFGIDALPGGWCDRYAHKDVRRELDKLRNEIAESAEGVLALELERLDDLLKGLWGEAARKNPDHGAVDRVLKIMQRRAKLLGLDAPDKHDVSGVSVQIVGIDPDGEI